jgi:hypothetical protein
MSALTPFGEVTLGDRISIERWLDAHDRKHQQYVVENIFTGQYTPNLGHNILIKGTGGVLVGPVDGDWMLRHAARHISLAVAATKLPHQPHKLPPLSSADTKVLLLPAEWQTEAELQDWHALHNRLHFLIDQVRQISGIQAKPHQPHLPGRPGNWFPGRQPP